MSLLAKISAALSAIGLGKPIPLPKESDSECGLVMFCIVCHVCSKAAQDVQCPKPSGAFYLLETKSAILAYQKDFAR